MSMGYAASFADSIEETELKKIIGNDGNGNDLIEQLHAQIDDIFECEYEAIDYLQDNPPCGDYDEDKAKQFYELYKTITEKFKEETGLELELNYHDSENEGSRYDDVDGIYWEVYGCYIPSPELLKLREKMGDDVVSRKFFTTFC